MNQLAIAIRKLNEGKNQLEECRLNLFEIDALKMIGHLIEMFPAELAYCLQLEDDPLEWLVPPWSLAK